jgi:hypothetical protein
MNKIRAILLLIIVSVSCRQPYDPPVKDSQNQFMVIEANLNPGPDSVAIVNLSRTAGLDSRVAFKKENNAQVTVEGKDNSLRQVAFKGNGVYSSPLNLVIGNEYRLRIKTAEGKEYLSEYIKAKKTPPIDSISWDMDDKGVHVYANAKDASGNSRYYRWEYDETWEIHSLFFSLYIYDNGIVRGRNFPAEDVYICWKSNSSTALMLANTTRLEDDIVYKFPLLTIPNGNERLGFRYSILLKQYALDRQAYNFLELMKRNTEQIGTVFSPQPSEIRGNIVSVKDPNEYVLGYVTASSVEQKRIFIEIPWQVPMYCPELVVPNHPDSIKASFGSGVLSPYMYKMDPPPGYAASFAECVDCTKRGGTKAKPSFW